MLSTRIDHCDEKFPRWDWTMDAFIKPIFRAGLMFYLVEVFSKTCGGFVAPIQLAKHLFDFK